MMDFLNIAAAHIYAQIVEDAEARARHAFDGKTDSGGYRRMMQGAAERAYRLAAFLEAERQKRLSSAEEKPNG